MIRDGRTSYRTPTNKPTPAPKGASNTAPGSGFGITPETLNKYFQNPSNDPSNNYRPTWTGTQVGSDGFLHGGGLDEVIAQQNARVAALRAQAAQYAKVYLDRAKNLELSASTGGVSNRTKGTLDYYGIDVSTRGGQRIAQQTAQHLRNLASRSYVGANGDLSGAERIVNFEHASRAAINKRAHLENQAALHEQDRQQSIWGRTTSALGHAAGVEMKPFAPIFNAGMRGYAAANYVAGHSDQGFLPTFGAAVKAGIGRSLGSSYLAGGKGSISREAFNATSNEEKIAALQKAGQIDNFGDIITGHQTAAYTKLHGAGLYKAPDINLVDVETLGIDRLVAQLGGLVHGATGLGWSAKDINAELDKAPHLNPATPANIAFQAGTDPTLYLGMGLGEYGDLSTRVGMRAEEAAMRAGVMDEASKTAYVAAAKTAYMTESNVGRSILDRATNGLSKASSVDQAVAYIGRNTPRRVVTEALEAGKTEGLQGVKDSLAKAFGEGRWHPHVSTIEHAARSMGLYTGSGRTIGQTVLSGLADVIGKARASEDITHVFDVAVTTTRDMTPEELKVYHQGLEDALPQTPQDYTRLFHGDRIEGDAKGGAGSIIDPSADPEKMQFTDSLHDAKGYGSKVGYVDVPNTAFGRNVTKMGESVYELGGDTAAKTAEHYEMPRHLAERLMQPTELEPEVNKQVVEQVKMEAKRLVQSKGGLRAPLEAMNVDQALDLSLAQAARLDNKWAGDIIGNETKLMVGDPAGRAVQLQDAAEAMGSPGFEAAVVEALAPLNTTLHEDMSEGLQRLVLHRLDKLEAVLSILKGDAGEDARSIVSDQLERKYSLTGKTVAEEAADAAKTHLGQEFLRGKPYEDVDPQLVRMVLADIEDAPTQAALKQELADAVGKKSFGEVAAAIDRIASNPQVAEDVARSIELNGRRLAVRDLMEQSALHADVGWGAGSSFLKYAVTGPAKAILALAEKRPLSMLHTLSSAYDGTNEQAITDYFDRLGGLLHLGSDERRTLADEAQSAAAAALRHDHEPGLQLYDKLVHLAFEKHGLDPELAQAFIDASRPGLEHVQVYGLDDAGEMVDRPFVIAQGQTTFTRDPNALMQAIREELAKQTRWGVNNIRVQFDKVLDKTVFSVFGKEFSIKGGLHEAEQFWKVMITTRAYSPLIGFGAGVVDGLNNGNDVWDSMQRGLSGAIIGAGVGMAGLLRYTERNWIQARISSMLFHGPTVTEWVPGLSRIFSRFQEPIYGAGANSLSNDLAEGSFINGGLSRTTTGEWEKLVRTPKNIKEFATSYGRIINLQVNPETDQMMLFMLQRKAGLPEGITINGVNSAETEWQASVDAWLQTDAGADWLHKAATMGMGPKTAVKRASEFVDRYVSPEMAQLRLAPESFGAGRSISVDKLVEMADKLPEAIHQQATESLYKKGPLNGAVGHWKAFVDRAAYDAPALTGSRRAFYNVEVRRLESRFTAAGVPREEAQQMAGEVAVRNTNAVMFRMDNTSRFSQRTDWISPFQGHREFNSKVWLKLASERPGATIRYGVHAAQAFNAGKDAGIFQKDPTTGQWTMSVPGSGPLSRALFGVLPGLGDQKVNLAGFLAMTEGGLSPDGDTSNPWLSALTAAVPRPGGPFWSIAVGEFAKQYPNVAESMPPGLRNLIFGPIGPSTRFLPADTDRLWQAIAGSPPPWNLLSEDEQKNDTEKYKLEVAKQLLAEHRLADQRAGRPVDMTWMPSDAAVMDGVKHLFLAWGFMRGVLPSSPHPVFRDHAQADQAFHHFVVLESRGSGMSPKEYESANYNTLRKDFTKKHPVLAPFFDATSKYVGPDDKRHWERNISSQDENALQKELGLRRNETWPEYKAALRQQAALHEAMDALHNAENTPGSRYDREAAMEAWRAKYPEEAKYLKSKYFAEKELAVIIRTYPAGSQVMRDAVDRWRKQYAPKGQTSWSKSQYNSMVVDIKKKYGQVMNPWSEARDSEVVYKSVQKATGHAPANGLSTIAYVRNHLSPAEQVRYWTQAVMHLSYVSGATQDPYKVGRAYSIYTSEIRDLYKKYPELLKYLKSDQSVAKAQVKAESPDAKAVEDWHTGQANSSQMLWAELSAARTAEQTAYTNKQFATSKMLSKRIKDIYAQLEVMKNATWSGSGIGMRDQHVMHDNIRELTYMHDIGKIGDREFMLKVEQANQRDANHVRFLPSNEEMHILAMPSAVRSAYYDNLIHNLSIPPGESKMRYAINAENPAAKGLFGTDPFAVNNTGVPVKTYWSYLSNFQQDQLKKFVPAAIWQGWAAQDPSMEKGGGKGGKGSRVGAGQDALGGADALKFAYDLMRSYSKRAGMAKPADYAAYLALPNSIAIRNDFLDKHPDVASYVAAGPMANMPAYYQMMVQQIMIRHGKWTGDLEDPQGMADLAFARAQMQEWTRRAPGANAPSTYDLWVNMPSGQAKAQYLQDHAEIRQWIQLGPMANMPDQYREVVRDIMLRYHQWTAEASDGLGTTIQQYYRTPSFARQQFLADHPELSAYWQATQTPEEAQMASLVSQYYAIPDPSARGTFLSSHPELQQHLLDARTQRYERFLNQVAVYMGQSPDLFQHYLDDQTAVLKDLLAKFSEPNLAKESHWMAPQKVSTKSTESGRQRS
ncbi:MAG: hypothetical protein ACXVGB_00315 [Mycobacteriaceae bacterium]